VKEEKIPDLDRKKPVPRTVTVSAFINADLIARFLTKFSFRNKR